MLRAAIAQEATGYRSNVNPIAAFDAELNPIARGIRKETAGDGLTPTIGADELTPRIELDIPTTLDPNANLSSGFKETYSLENSRTADISASRQADELIARGDLELDQSITDISDSVNDLAKRNDIDIAGIIDEYQVPVREAETDSKALEAAVLCRIQL